MPSPSPFRSFVSSTWAFVCPRPETDDELNPPSVFRTYERALSTIRQTNDRALIEAIADLSKELFEDTRDRRGHVESRASATVTAAGIGLAALAGIASLWSQQSQRVAWLPAITIGAIVIALLYLISAIASCQRVYGENVRSTLGPPDIAPAQGVDKLGFSLHVSALRIEYSINNYRANNKALGFVLAAQQRLRRGVTLLAIAGGMVLIFQTPKSTGTTPVSITAQTVQLYAASQPGTSPATTATSVSPIKSSRPSSASSVTSSPSPHPNRQASVPASRTDVASAASNTRTPSRDSGNGS